MPHPAFPPAMRKLVNALLKLPSVGERSAIRLAYHLITSSRDDALDLAAAIREARDTIQLCDTCFALTENDRCSMCRDPNRNQALICVVEKPADVIAIERSSNYRGVYHVLHGLWSPLRGVAPGETKLGALFERVRKSHAEREEITVEELVIATSTTVEGDATALYIANSIGELPVRITRIAQGLPKGGELEYADEVTVSHALEGRRRI